MSVFTSQQLTPDEKEVVDFYEKYKTILEKRLSEECPNEAQSSTSDGSNATMTTASGNEHQLPTCGTDARNSAGVACLSGVD